MPERKIQKLENTFEGARDSQNLKYHDFKDPTNPVENTAVCGGMRREQKLEAKFGSFGEDEQCLGNFGQSFNKFL